MFNRGLFLSINKDCNFLQIVFATHVLKSQHRYSRKKNRERNKEETKKEKKKGKYYGEFQNY